MKNIKLVRNLFVIVSVFAIMFVLIQTNSVFAEEGDLFDFDNFQRIEATDGNNTSGNNTAGGNVANGTGNNTSNANQAGNNTSIGNMAGNNTSNQVANRNISNSNELADTGIGATSGIITLIVVICGISAVYSYKKVNDYKNL